MDKNNLLKSVSLFYDLSERELGYISSRMIAKKFETGNLIFMENSEGEKCFFVAEGSVKVTRLSKDGKEVILAMLNKGEFFGEMALLDNENRSANAIAKEDSILLKINQDVFYELMESNADIMKQIIKLLTGRIRTANAKLELNL